MQSGITNESPLPRLNILKNATRKGLLIPFDPKLTLTQLRYSIADHLKMPHVEYLFNTHGCEITDTLLVRDNDVIIASATSKFEKPGTKKPAETAIYTMLKECLKMVLKAGIGLLKKYLAEAITAA